jgi:hypothetical protein
MMDDPDWIIEVREWLKLCKQLAEKRRVKPTTGGKP